MKTMIWLNILRRLHFLSGFFLIAILTGCLPENQSLDQSLKDSIGVTRTLGFKGLETVQTITGSKLQLSWTESTDPEVVAYNIYDTTNMFNPILVATIPIPSSGTFLTKGANGNPLVAGTYYSFNVKAVTAKQKEDDNTVNKGAIPYSGVISYQIIDGSTVKLTINNPSNADRAKAFCKVGLTAITETLLATQEDVSKTEITLTGLTAGTQYTCRVGLEIGAFVDNNKNTVTFIPLGMATRLVFINQPTNGQAGVVWGSQPVVAIQDDNGNTVAAGPDSNAAITLTISSGSVSGTVFLNAVNGIATFTGLSTADMGIKTLTATKEDKSGFTNGAASLSVTSNQFTIAAGPVSPLFSSISLTALSGTPPLIANGSDSYSVKMTLKDQFGNPVSGVLPQFASNILAGDTLVQPSVATNTSGEATGSITTLVADDVAPFRKLSISSPSGLSDVFVLAPFTAGPAVKLGFISQPTYSNAGMSTFQVGVFDSNGNIVRSSAASITVALSSASNLVGATLSGQTNVSAVSGTATFSGLLIDKSANGYKLTANSGTLTEALSNPFNVTAGTPTKLVIAGANSVKSGQCSTAVTVQIQDVGGNPTKPASTKNIILSGLGSAKVYTSNTCTGGALNVSSSFTLSFNTSTNTKTIYISNTKSEVLNLVASETNLSAGNKTFVVTPSQIRMQAPTSVIAGLCSSAIVVTPLGSDSASAPIAVSSTTVAITGLGSSAKLYNDSSCTTEVNASSLNLPITTAAPSLNISYYIKSDKSESLSLNITDLNSVSADQMATLSGAQPITILPSDIELTGPTSVVAGACSTAYTIKLKDRLGNFVTPNQNIILKVNGLSGKQGRFYLSSSSCSSGSGAISAASTITFSSGSPSMSLFFKDTAAESLAISIVDSASVAPKMNDSNIINIGVSPSALQLSTSLFPLQADTSLCVGPFVLNTMDGQATPQVTNAISPITVNLSTTGYSVGFEGAGAFYTTSSCSTKVNSIIFNAGENTKNLYFKGQYPGSINLVATDAGSILTSANLSWTVKAARAFLGGSSKMFDDFANKTFSFRASISPTSAYVDGPTTIRGMAFDPTKRFLYVADEGASRILKYDYTNGRYIGWIGKIVKMNDANTTVPVTGSMKDKIPGDPAYTDLPSASSCVNTVNAQTLPGWCVGGISYNWDRTTDGNPYGPKQLVVDDTYIYVLNNVNTITRHFANTGAFDGWIGHIQTAPTTAVMTGGPANCSSFGFDKMTPGWCSGGANARPWDNGGPRTSRNSDWGYGDGTMSDVNSIAQDSNYLYVGQRGAIFRFAKASGAFSGWIGKYHAGAPSQPALSDADGGAGGCTTPGAWTNSVTPGWCIGGAYYRAVTTTESRQGAIGNGSAVFVDGNNLIVFDAWNGGVANVYNKNTGAFIRFLPDFININSAPYALFKDSLSGNLIGADTSSNRLVALDSNGGVVGWMGKVNTNPSGVMQNAMSFNGNCSGLNPSDNTPGWCLGGTSRGGFDIGAYREVFSVVDDGTGHMLVAEYRVPSIRKLKIDTGEYVGSMGFDGKPDNGWNNDAITLAQKFGIADDQFYSPQGTYNDGTYLYVADANNGRIKKYELATGQLVGSIGGITTKPTGGESGCTAFSPMIVSNKWCLGALPNLWSATGVNVLGNNNMDGLMRYPISITGDGAGNLYVVDNQLHRVLKFSTSGAYIGWTGGNISSVPTTCTNTSAPPTNGALTPGIGSYTPGWCKGGMSNWSATQTQGLRDPGAITYQAGYLYVADNSNNRIVRYDAATGAFSGWVGRFDTTNPPTIGCTATNTESGVNVANGWCMNGLAQIAKNQCSGTGMDRGGGFAFWSAITPSTQQTATNGVASDSSSLYIANHCNNRIDKIALANGVWQGAYSTRWNNGSGAALTAGSSVYSTDPAVVVTWTGQGRITGLAVNSTHIYFASRNDPTSGWDSGSAIVKVNKSSGAVIGWQGSIHTNPAWSVTGGDCPAGATGLTPGWCLGGASARGIKLGEFDDARALSVDDNFVYVSDVNTHRVTRIPK